MINGTAKGRVFGKAQGGNNRISLIIDAALRLPLVVERQVHAVPLVGHKPRRRAPGIRDVGLQGEVPRYGRRPAVAVTGPRPVRKATAARTIIMVVVFMWVSPCWILFH